MEYYGYHLIPRLVTVSNPGKFEGYPNKKKVLIAQSDIAFSLERNKCLAQSYNLKEFKDDKLIRQRPDCGCSETTVKRQWMAQFLKELQCRWGSQTREHVVSNKLIRVKYPPQKRS